MTSPLFSYNLKFYGKRNAENTNGGKRSLHRHRVNYPSYTCCSSCITVCPGEILHTYAWPHGGGYEFSTLECLAVICPTILDVFDRFTGGHRVSDPWGVMPPKFGLWGGRCPHPHFGYIWAFRYSFPLVKGSCSHQLWGQENGRLERDLTELAPSAGPPLYQLSFRVTVNGLLI